MHGAHRSPGPLQWQHRAGPLLAGSEGPRRAGLPRSAPLRPALRDRASLPARPAAASQVLSNAARTLEPLALPRPYSWPRGARRGSVGPGQVCGERGIEKPRVRPACGLSGSVCPHPGCGPASLRCHRGTGAGGRNRILCFWLSHFSFKGQTSAHIARSFKTRTPMVIAIAKHPRLALRCLDLISLGAVLEEESAGSRRLVLPPRLSAYAPVRGRHGKYFLH